MNVGEYVRTKLGIAKYIGKYDDYEGFYEFDKLDDELWSGDISNVVYSSEIDNVVIKSSPNIIDLIEEGDIVKIEHQGWHQVSTKFETLKFFDDEGTEYLYDEIRAIITREQLESMEYKVGD